MKKISFILLSLFIFLFSVTSCSKREYKEVAEELNNEKFDYVELIDEDNNSNKVICNYVKTVWGGDTDLYDVHDTILKFSFLCDFNKEYKVKINIPEHKSLRITGVNEYYFYNFDTDKDESKELTEYEIIDNVMTLNLDFKEFNNQHVFQYYKINFKIDKTHYGYYYFGVRYGNELTPLKSTLSFLNDIDQDKLEYLKIKTPTDIHTITSNDFQSTLIDLINSVYLLKIEVKDYEITKSIEFEFKLKNDDSTHSVIVDQNMICNYNGAYYLFIVQNSILKNYINNTTQ